MVRCDFNTPGAAARFAAWRARHAAAMADVVDVHIPAAMAAAAAPRIAVFDIDEVLLCNIRAAAPDSPQPECAFERPVLTRGAHPHTQRFVRAAMRAGGDGWPPDATWAHLTADGTGLNPPMPGAAGALEACHRRGIAVRLVTGRAERLRADTLANLEITGMLGGRTGLAWGDNAEWLVMKPDGCARSAQAYKAAARAKIAAAGCIVLNVGDQLSDMGDHGDGCAQVLIPHDFYVTH